MDDADPAKELEEVIEALQRRVAERRQAGLYPEGLEEALDAHFQRLGAHRASPYDYGPLERLLAEVERTAGLSPQRISLESGMPGGTALHAAIGKAVSRQTAGVLAQVSEFAAAVRDALREVAAVVQHPHGHAHPDLVAQMDAVFDRLGVLQRAPDDAGPAVAKLVERVERLERHAARQDFRPWFSSESFENAFRGSSEELRERYRDLAGRLAGADPVVDIGCGRGEFLSLLVEQGTEARGIEVDADLVAHCRDAGLDVALGDAIGYLSCVADGELGGISLIQVVEHLTPQEVVEFASLAADKVRPGGRVVVETVNPQSIYVYAHAFYLDPTHTTPVHPAYLRFLLSEAGFAEVGIEWRDPPPADDILEPLTGEAEAGPASRNVERLNRLLFAPQDYAIIAIR